MYFTTITLKTNTQGQELEGVATAEMPPHHGGLAGRSHTAVVASEGTLGAGPSPGSHPAGEAPEPAGGTATAVFPQPCNPRFTI